MLPRLEVPPRARWRFRWGWHAVPLLMLAASLLLRAFSFVPAVIDTDEGLYIVQAREWLDGGWPLDKVWDMHPIGAPAMVALGLAIFGQSIAAVRLLGAIFVAATGWALYGTARAGGLPRPPALAAGMLYIALTTQFGGLATNTEILFAPFAVAAMAYGLRTLERRVPPVWGDLIPMGVLVGIALTIKPVAAPEGCLAFALLAFPALWRRLLPWRRALAMAAAYALLCALPTLLLALAYALRGQFDEFLDGAFLAPLRYAGGRLALGDAAWEIGTAAMILIWPLALAVVSLLLPRGVVERRLAVVGSIWLATATLAVAGPGMFYNHYFLVWLPSVSLMAALGAWRLGRLVKPEQTVLALAVIVGAIGINAWSVDAVGRMRSGIGLRNPDPVRQVAAAVAAVIPPGAPVLMANYHAVVQFLAGSGLATRYAFPAHFTGHYGDVAGIDMDAEVARVLAARPAAIVIDRGWWPAIRPVAQAMLTRTLAEAYVLAATVREERGRVEIWRLRPEPAPAPAPG